MIAIKQPQLAAGQFHSHGLDGGGRIWSWGYASNGSLGVGKSWDDRLLPEIVENIGLVTALSSSFNHTVALDMSGAVWTWGYIVDGYLGDGSDNTKQWAPVQVRDNGGYLENVVKVAAGWSHSVALKKDGTVWTWGRDHYGQLGNGQQGSGIIAEQVTGLTDIVSVSAGGDFTLALDSFGNVWGWGANWSGCLGIGTTTRWSTPVQIPNLPKITAIAAGAYHSLLLDASERVWASGRNDYGQLGKGSEGDSLSFTLIGLESIVAISAGASHSLALGRDGKVRAWGRNSFGQCGGESENPQMSPILVAGIDKVARIEAGANHSLALREDGSIWTWGRNNYGQLGNGAKDESGSFNPVPAEISFRLFGTPGGGGLTNGHADAEVRPVGPQWPVTAEGHAGRFNIHWTAIQAQENGLYRVTLEYQREYDKLFLAMYKLVETEDGSKLRLVGNQSDSLLALSQGEVRYIAVGMEIQPDNVYESGWYSLYVSYAGKAAPDVKRSQLAAGQFHSHGVNTSGTVWSWGYAGNGSLGVGKSWDNRLIPEEMRDFGVIAVLSGSYNHTVAVKMDGTVWAWGYIVDGYLGDGSDNTKQWTPVQIRDSGGYLENVVKVAAGWSHSVALKKDGTVWTWGRDHYGQLGNGQQESGIVAEQVAGLTDIVAVAAGGDFTLALDSFGNVWGWGANWSGGLGIGTTTRWSIPVQIPNLPQITAVAAGGYHSLLLDADKRVWASGRNDYGQLGNNSESHSLFFVPLGLENIVEISAGASHSLALGRDGKVRAWGRNSFGQCGGSVQEPQMSPVIVADINNVVHMEAGGNHCLALRGDGSIWTWGRNNYGQLGNGARDESDSFNPVPVAIGLQLFEPETFDGWEEAETYIIGADKSMECQGAIQFLQDAGRWLHMIAEDTAHYYICLEKRAQDTRRMATGYFGGASGLTYQVYRRRTNHAGEGYFELVIPVDPDAHPENGLYYLQQGNDYYIKIKYVPDGPIGIEPNYYITAYYKQDDYPNTWTKAYLDPSNSSIHDAIGNTAITYPGEIDYPEDEDWIAYQCMFPGISQITLQSDNPHVVYRVFEEDGDDIRELEEVQPNGYEVAAYKVLYVKVSLNNGEGFTSPIPYTISLSGAFVENPPAWRLAAVESFFPQDGIAWSGSLEADSVPVSEKWYGISPQMAGTYPINLQCGEPGVRMELFQLSADGLTPLSITDNTAFLSRYNFDNTSAAYYVRVYCEDTSVSFPIPYQIILAPPLSGDGAAAPLGTHRSYTIRSAGVLHPPTMSYRTGNMYRPDDINWISLKILHTGYYSCEIYPAANMPPVTHEVYEKKYDAFGGWSLRSMTPADSRNYVFYGNQEILIKISRTTNELFTYPTEYYFNIYWMWDDGYPLVWEEAMARGALEVPAAPISSFEIMSGTMETKAWYYYTDIDWQAIRFSSSGIYRLIRSPQFLSVEVYALTDEILQPVPLYKGEALTYIFHAGVEYFVKVTTNRYKTEYALVIDSIPDDHADIWKHATSIDFSGQDTVSESGLLEYIDWFKLHSGTINATYAIELAGQTGYPIYRIYVLDTASNTLEAISPLGANIYRFESGKTYYIKVSHDASKPYSNGASYTLEMRKKTAVSFNVAGNRLYYVSLTGCDLTGFDSQNTIQYDSSKLQLIDFAAQTPEENITAGAIPAANLQIISHTTGMITFKCTRSIPQGKAWTGVIAMLKFKATAAGQAFAVLSNETVTSHSILNLNTEGTEEVPGESNGLSGYQQKKEF